MYVQGGIRYRVSDLEGALDRDYGLGRSGYSEEENRKDILPHGNDNGLAVSPMSTLSKQKIKLRALSSVGNCISDFSGALLVS